MKPAARGAKAQLELSEWRTRLLNRLLDVQLVLIAIALPATLELSSRWGIERAIAILLVLCLLATARYPRWSTLRLKLATSIGSFAFIGLGSIFVRGTNGVASVSLESTFILGTLFLGVRKRVALLACLFLVFGCIVMVQTHGRVKFVDAGNPHEWLVLLFLCAPGFAVVLIAQKNVVNRLSIQSEEQAASTTALLQERQERLEAQRILEDLAGYLESLISVVQQLQTEPTSEATDLTAVARNAAIAMGNVELVIDQDLVLNADQRLAASAMQCLLQEISKNGRPPRLELLSANEGVRAIGVSESFLDAIEAWNKQAPIADSRTGLPDLAPLTFVRLCRRLGGQVTTEWRDSNTRELRFSFAA